MTSHSGSPFAWQARSTSSMRPSPFVLAEWMTERAEPFDLQLDTGGIGSEGVALGDHLDAGRDGVLGALDHGRTGHRLEDEGVELVLGEGVLALGDLRLRVGVGVEQGDVDVAVGIGDLLGGPDDHFLDRVGLDRDEVGDLERLAVSGAARSAGRRRSVAGASVVGASAVVPGVWLVSPPASSASSSPHDAATSAKAAKVPSIMPAPRARACTHGCLPCGHRATTPSARRTTPCDASRSCMKCRRRGVQRSIRWSRTGAGDVRSRSLARWSMWTTS